MPSLGRAQGTRLRAGEPLLVTFSALAAITALELCWLVGALRGCWDMSCPRARPEFVGARQTQEICSSLVIAPYDLQLPTL